MLVRRFAVIIVAAAWLLLIMQSQAVAQKVNWNDVKGEGQVHSRQGQGLAMTLKGGNLWLATFGPGSKVTVNGTASADYLRQGVAVKFNGDFDRKTGVASAPISEITIITIRPGEKAGLIPDEVVSLPGAGRGGSVLGGAGAASTTVSGSVVGAIASLKENAIQVGKYKGELAPDVKINVALGDPFVASQGDAVDVKGKWSEIDYGNNKKVSNNAGEVPGPGGVKVQKPGIMVVEEMTITLLNPLAAPKKKGPPPSLKGLPELGKTVDAKKEEMAKDAEEK